jgi:hypothetical protein
MSDESGADKTAIHEVASKLPEPPRTNVFQLPGVAAICLYLAILALVNIVGVAGGNIRPVYLVFSAIFFAAALGLLMLMRWAWTLTLAAVVFLAGLFLWKFSIQHEIPFIVQGLLNLVFFLYLVRTEVREKLR